MPSIIPSSRPKKKKRNVFIDLRKFLSDINIRATKGSFQSTNFEDSVTGWRMNSDGLIEGTRLKLDNFIPSDDSSIVYSGTWAEAAAITTLDQKRTRSVTVGDTFTITFTGSSIGLVMEKAGDQGKFSVSIDGGASTTVDLYQSEVSWRSVVYSATGLAPGEHTLVCTVETKNASASNNRVSLQGYVKSPTEGIKLSDISADLYLFAADVTTDANGYAASSAFTLPTSNTVVWSIVGVYFADTSDMSDATLTEPKICWRDQVIYLYNGAADTTYSIGRMMLISNT